MDRDIEVDTEPVWVDGDAFRLEQVLTNLVTNAVKYTSSGDRIRVTLRAEGGDAVLSVEDTGAGISPMLLPAIFDLYVQADRTLNRSRGGLGIGLALVRRLVALHGGTVEAASDGEGCGARFTVRLGRIPSPGESSGLSYPMERRANPRSVLLIENSGDAREMLRAQLELAGHNVYDAEDGARGLELVKAVQPEVGIIDISVASLDGCRIAKQIRDDPHGRDMLLVALTERDPADDSTPSSAHAFDYHLGKPVDADRLARLIGEVA